MRSPARLDLDLTTEPLGTDTDGKPVHLADIWPSDAEVQALMLRSIDSQMFRDSYASVFKGDDNWANIKVPAGQLYAWDPGSTYVKNPPYFDAMTMTPSALRDVRGGARAGGARRLGHHRPHLARRQHRQEQPGGALSGRTGRRAPRTSTPTARAAAITRS